MCFSSSTWKRVQTHSLPFPFPAMTFFTHTLPSAVSCSFSTLNSNRTTSLGMIYKSNLVYKQPGGFQSLLSLLSKRGRFLFLPLAPSLSSSTLSLSTRYSHPPSGTLLPPVLSRSLYSLFLFLPDDSRGLDSQSEGWTEGNVGERRGEGWRCLRTAKGTEGRGRGIQGSSGRLEGRGEGGERREGFWKKRRVVAHA